MSDDTNLSMCTTHVLFLSPSVRRTSLMYLHSRKAAGCARATMTPPEDNVTTVSLDRPHLRDSSVETTLTEYESLINGSESVMSFKHDR